MPIACKNISFSKWSVQPVGVRLNNRNKNKSCDCGEIKGCAVLDLLSVTEELASLPVHSLETLRVTLSRSVAAEKGLVKLEPHSDVELR